METKIINYDFGGQSYSVQINERGEPQFNASEVCCILGYKNPRKEVSIHCRKEGVTKCYTPTKGGLQQTTFISEGNLYRLIMRSKMPEAEKFEREVCDVVLPSIRKTGGYIAAKEEETPEQLYLRAMSVLKETVERQKQKVQMLSGENEFLHEENKHLAPKAEYTDAVLQSNSTYTLTQAAHDLGLRSVYSLTGWLSKLGILYYQSGQWQPTAKVSDKEYFTTRTAKFVRSDDTVGTTLSTVVTEKGRLYLHTLIKEKPL
ncbi:hypothetical protein FACS1894195_5140 [Bacteroidia bacterium]|nr:hypothetical protein FACS1894195_5140 [Bacteroidia bacterium]